MPPLVRPARRPGRPIHMRVAEVLAVAVAVSLLGACGQSGGPEAARDRSGITGRVLLGPQCPAETATDPCDAEPASGANVTVAETARTGAGSSSPVAVHLVVNLGAGTQTK